MTLPRTDSEGVLLCPKCGFEYQHPGAPKIIPGRDNYEAGWGGRGDLTVVPFRGECGHNWELCLGFHKGCTTAFVRTLPDTPGETL